MECCSGTELFDSVVNKVLQQDITDNQKVVIIESLVRALWAKDWD
jgi:hypothetical protein